MKESKQLEDALALALKLLPRERLRLVEQIVTSVEQDMAAGMIAAEQQEHWGQSLTRLLDALDLSDWEALAIDDPLEWVKALRRPDESRLDGYWNSTQ